MKRVLVLFSLGMTFVFSSISHAAFGPLPVLKIDLDTCVGVHGSIDSRSAQVDLFFARLDNGFIDREEGVAAGDAEAANIVCLFRTSVVK